VAITPAVALDVLGCATVAGSFEQAVCTATGPIGLVIIAAYSFLVAVVLPFPSEIVLVPAEHMRLGLPLWVTLAVIVLVSAVAKVAGSLLAFWVGQGVKQSGPVIRFFRRSRFDVIEWSERQSVAFARRFGYVGLAALLSIPGFPDTITIYAFTVLEDDYYRFALATFVGSVGRLLVTITVVGGATLAL
jgi:membrane protein YqaA with SNARE-associated domain